VSGTCEDAAGNEWLGSTPTLYDKPGPSKKRQFEHGKSAFCVRTATFDVSEVFCCSANDSLFDSQFREPQARFVECFADMGPSGSGACARALPLFLARAVPISMETASWSMGSSCTRMDVGLQLAAVRVRLVSMCVQAGTASNEACHVVIAERST
jgi:hypothetical protein